MLRNELRYIEGNTNTNTQKVAMKFHNTIIILIILLTLAFICNGERLMVRHLTPFGVESIRRNLHQSLFPDSSLPLMGDNDDSSSLAPPPPPPSTAADSSGYGSDQPFFPEVPSTGSIPNPYQSPPSQVPPPTITNGSGPIPTTPQPTKPTKKVAIAVSVGIVTLGMLSALAFYLYRHRVKHPAEEPKLVGDGNSRAPPSNFLYIGTVEPVIQRSETGSDANAENGSPYHKLNDSVKRASDRYRPSPDLQPLSPLSKAPSIRNVPDRNHISTPPGTILSDDEGTRDAMFYTPNGSVASIDDRFWTPALRSISGRGTNSMNSVYRGDGPGANYLPHSKKTSPKSRVLGSSPDIARHAIIPSIKAAPTPPSPPFSISNSPSHKKSKPPTPPPPPPPPRILKR